MKNTRGIAYVFAAAGACLTSLSGAQQQTAAQSGSTLGSTSRISVTPPGSGTSSYRRPPTAAILQARVNVSFSGLPLEQAVDALAKATGTRIQLERVVKTDARVTIDAHEIPLYRVLEVLTHQPGTDLMISPDGNVIVLEPWPSLEVNGKKEQYRGANAPWSDAWYRESSSPQSTRGAGSLAGAPAQPATSPFAITEDSGSSNPAFASQPSATTALPPAGSPFGQSAGGPTPMPEFAQPGMPGMGPGMGAAAGYSLNGSLSVMVTALSDKSFVVTEPGLGPKNEVGVYLTVYRVEGEGTKSGAKIVEVSRAFHRSANAGRSFGVPAVAPNRWRDRGSMGSGTMAPGVSGTGGGGPGAYWNPAVTPVAPPAPPSGTRRPGAQQPAVPPSPGFGTPNFPPAPPTSDSTSAPKAPQAAVSPVDPTGNRIPAGDVPGGGKSRDDPFDEN